MRIFVAALFLGLIIASSPFAFAQQGPDIGARVEPGPMQLMRLAPPFRPEPTNFHLAEYIGKKPVVFLYWLPEYQASVNELVELDKLAKTLKGNKIAILSVSRARDPREIDAIRKVIEARGISIPVLLDDMTMMMKLGVTTVPSFVAVNKDGRIAINEVSTLKNKLQNGTLFKTALLDADKSGTLPAVKGPGQNAMFQLLGEKAIPFSLKNLQGQLVSTVDYVGQKPTMILFWSALCPHCQRELPRVQAYLDKNPGKMNVISVTRFTNDDHKTRTHGFVKEKNIRFPVLVDDGVVNDKYSVSGIPAWVLVDTNGNISYAATGEKEGLEAVLTTEVAKATVAPAAKPAKGAKK